MNPLAISPVAVTSFFALGQAQAQANVDANAIPWDELRTALTSPSTSLEPGGFAPWREECLVPLSDKILTSTFGGITFGPSNYELIADPTGGQCMVFGQSCAYFNCIWPYSAADDMNALVERGTELRPELLNLPSMVVFPETAGDIVSSVKFASENNIEVKVKSTGHSHVGDSTGRDALLINMRRYPRYADPDTDGGGLGAIVECAAIQIPSAADANSDPADADASVMACELARARGVQALIRAGGGQIFDEVLRTLNNWNEAAAAAAGDQPSSSGNQYHLVTGASGTVGSSGGWLAGGGLGLTQAGRHFGFGVDQVLLFEMVLPTGQHVRFGPTAWSLEEAQAQGLLQPTTTEVTGYCNANPDATDESEWEWTDCADTINFADLWFALRGGGGGSFGIVTAVYYQLQDRPGDMEVVMFPSVSDGEWVEALKPLWVDFYLDFFVEPTSGGLPGVTAEDSNMCGSYISQHTFSGPAQQPQTFFCFSGAGRVLASAWEEYVLSHAESLTTAGLNQDEVNAIASDNTVYSYPSYAAFSLDLPEPLSLLRNPSNPEGRASDLVPGVFVDRGQGGMQMHQVPRSLLVEKREEMASFLKGLTSTGKTYMMGGNHLITHDQMSSMPIASREAAFLIDLENDEEKAQLFEIMFGDMQQDGNFPGLFCLNIALVNDIGPQKEDWAKPCNKTWSKSEQQDKCISFQEATWGTDLLKRLEDIKTTVDPKSLFVQEYGIKGNSGVRDPETNETESDPSDTTSPPPLIGGDSTCDNSLASPVVFGCQSDSILDVEISYPGGVQECGATLTISQAAEAPTFKIPNIDSGALYTVLMIDTTVSDVHPILHFGAVNVAGGDFKDGANLANMAPFSEYRGPAPPSPEVAPGIETVPFNYEWVVVAQAGPVAVPVVESVINFDYETFLLENTKGEMYTSYFTTGHCVASQTEVSEPPSTGTPETDGNGDDTDTPETITEVDGDTSVGYYFIVSKVVYFASAFVVLFL